MNVSPVRCYYLRFWLFVQEHRWAVSSVHNKQGAKHVEVWMKQEKNLLVMPGVKAGKGSAEDRDDSADVSN